MCYTSFHEQFYRQFARSYRESCHGYNATIDRDLFDSRDLISARREAEAVIEADDCGDGLKLLLKDIINGVTEIEDEVGEEFHFGTTFIADSYFEKYAEEFADDIGAINREQDWPLNCIDWKKAADQLKIDYISITIEGKEYWVR